LGGAGASADALSIWICQWVSREIRVLDYIEGRGQVLAFYTAELRSRGYEKAICVLPHDGVASNSITGKRYRDHLEDAGFETQVIPNQGKGAAMQRIEGVRRLFPQIWFNEKACELGLEALGYYHERRDEARNAGLGPDHDWSSHAADAFGLMAIAYEAPDAPGAREERYRPRRYGAAGADGWLAG
jgi:phage terminase large subunit